MFITLSIGSNSEVYIFNSLSLFFSFSKFWTRNRLGDKMRDKYNLNILDTEDDAGELDIPVCCGHLSEILPKGKRTVVRTPPKMTLN